LLVTKIKFVDKCIYICKLCFIDEFISVDKISLVIKEFLVVFSYFGDCW